MSAPKKTIRSSDWEATFPAKQDNDGDSLQFVKRLLYISFTHILKFRNLLPDACFKKRKCEGIRLGELNGSNPRGAFVARSILGACNAMDKKYLKELHLVIHEKVDKEEEASEAYVMRVIYNGLNYSAEIASGQNRMEIRCKGGIFVRHQTKSLLTRIYKITSHLEVLPPNSYFTFRIYYYDENTPKGYQAETFEADHDSYHLPPEAQALNIGEVDSGKYAGFLTVRSVYIDDHMEFEERISSDSTLFETLRSSMSISMDNDDLSILPQRNADLQPNAQPDAALGDNATAPVRRTEEKEDQRGLEGIRTAEKNDGATKTRAVQQKTTALVKEAERVNNRGSKGQASTPSIATPPTVESVTKVTLATPSGGNLRSSTPPNRVLDGRITKNKKKTPGRTRFPEQALERTKA